jgi:hypothetical protein
MAKRKKGSINGPFFALPHIVLDHPDFHLLSGPAIKVLMYLGRQYKPGKNGDLSASFTDMKPRGIASKTTLKKALDELMQAGWIIRTREGRFINPGGRCALYALSWHPVDECPGKGLEVNPTTTPPRKLSLEIIKTPSTETVPTAYRNCTDDDKKESQIVQFPPPSVQKLY